MKAYIDKAGFIVVEAETHVEAMAMRYNQDQNHESGGVLLKMEVEADTHISANMEQFTDEVMKPFLQGERDLAKWMRRTNF